MTDQEEAAARRIYRVEYDYNGSSPGKPAWFSFMGTDAEFLGALSAIFREPFEVFHMKITNQNITTRRNDDD